MYRVLGPSQAGTEHPTNQQSVARRVVSYPTGAVANVSRGGCVLKQFTGYPLYTYLSTTLRAFSQRLVFLQYITGGVGGNRQGVYFHVCW